MPQSCDEAARTLSTLVRNAHPLFAISAYYAGLFAPSAGQNMREEQRRRRSQFDRGTSLAEREEYGFDESEWVFPRSYAGPSRCQCPPDKGEGLN